MGKFYVPEGDIYFLFIYFLHMCATDESDRGLGKVACGRRRGLLSEVVADLLSKILLVLARAISIEVRQAVAGDCCGVVSLDVLLDTFLHQVVVAAPLLGPEGITVAEVEGGRVFAKGVLHFVSLLWLLFLCFLIALLRARRGTNKPEGDLFIYLLFFYFFGTHSLLKSRRDSGIIPLSLNSPLGCLVARILHHFCLHMY